MHIWSVTPIHVAPDELQRRQARYDLLCPPNVTVTLKDIGAQAPTQLATAQDIADSAGMVEAALSTAPDEADAVMPDCVLDPGVEALSKLLDRPVFGLLRTSATWSVLAGQSFAAVARNQAIADEIARLVGVYRIDQSFTGVSVLDLDVDAIHQSERWAAALEGAVHHMADAGAGQLINGCSAVDLPPEAASWPVQVIDPTQLTLRLIGAGAQP